MLDPRLRQPRCAEASIAQSGLCGYTPVPTTGVEPEGRARVEAAPYATEDLIRLSHFSQALLRTRRARIR